MSATRYASVLGLGFGDCGKGLFVDALTRRWQAHTVVRFSGGAQAGHNVVAPRTNGAGVAHHTFSQFGAGTLVPGTRTALLDPFILHPTALLVEAEALARIGADDALARLSIDRRCRLTTPFHQAAGRLREWMRGADAHGTCGVGVGETVRHALDHPDQIVRYADLAHSNNTSSLAALEKLQATRETLLKEFRRPEANDVPRWVAAEFSILRDETLAGRWLNAARALARHCPPCSLDSLAAQLRQPGCVLFEGSQGILLDEWRGFHPHTTWSSLGADAVEEAIRPLGLGEPIRHYGVLRPYLTRHGAGPFPTHDPSLDDMLTESHNPSDGWQGLFRRGHPDGVLLRYALDAVGPLSGLLVSHLDVFRPGSPLKWCERYTGTVHEDNPVNHIPLGSRGDLARQASLADWLGKCRPQYSAKPVDSTHLFLDRLAEVTDLPVLLGSHGPTASDVRGIQGCPETDCGAS